MNNPNPYLYGYSYDCHSSLENYVQTKSWCISPHKTRHRKENLVEQHGLSREVKRRELYLVPGEHRILQIGESWDFQFILKLSGSRESF